MWGSDTCGAAGAPRRPVRHGPSARIRRLLTFDAASRSACVVWPQQRPLKRLWIGRFLRSTSAATAQACDLAARLISVVALATRCATPVRSVCITDLTPFLGIAFIRRDRSGWRAMRPTCLVKPRPCRIRITGAVVGRARRGGWAAHGCDTTICPFRPGASSRQDYVAARPPESDAGTGRPAAHQPPGGHRGRRPRGTARAIGRDRREPRPGGALGDRWGGAPRRGGRRPPGRRCRSARPSRAPDQAPRTCTLADARDAIAPP